MTQKIVLCHPENMYFRKLTSYRGSANKTNKNQKKAVKAHKPTIKLQTTSVKVETTKDVQKCCQGAKIAV